MNYISIAMTLILAVLNLMFSDKIIKKPAVLSSGNNIDCSSCSKCLLKNRIMKNGEKLYEQVEKLLQIIIVISYVAIVVSVIVLCIMLFKKDVIENFIITIALLLAILLLIPFIWYLVVSFYCFIFKNIE
jgi:hypothetical protein